MHAGENPFAVERIHGLSYRFDDPDPSTNQNRRADTDGPLGTAAVAELSRRFWEAVQRGQNRWVLAGDHGCGKTTLLKELGRFWQQQGKTIAWLRAAPLQDSTRKDRWWKRWWDGMQTATGTAPIARGEFQVLPWQPEIKKCSPARQHSVQATKEFDSLVVLPKIMAAAEVVVLDGGESLPPATWRQLRQCLDDRPLLTTAHRLDWLPVLYRCETSPGTFLCLCRALLAESPPTVQRHFTDDHLQSVFDRHRGDLRQSFFQLYDQAAQL